jgi:hypothetical protein
MYSQKSANLLERPRTARLEAEFTQVEARN